MRKLTYSMGVSLDGFIAGPGGEIDWSPPDEELHRFHNQLLRETGVHLCGRRLYEVMTYWETADQNPSARDYLSKVIPVCAIAMTRLLPELKLRVDEKSEHKHEPK